MVENLLSTSFPPDWEYTTLGEVVKRGDGLIQTGPFGSQLHASDYVPSGIPFVMPVNIGRNRIDATGIARISEANAARLARYRLHTGDIVYSRRGDVEKRALVRSEQDGWVCGSGCLMVRVSNSVADPVFVSYYLGLGPVRQWIVRHAVGATMPNLNTAIMASLPFYLPPLDEQQRVAKLLSALDERIELNLRMNETLAAVAESVFTGWLFGRVT